MKLKTYKLWTVASVLAGMIAVWVEFSGWSAFAEAGLSEISGFVSLIPSHITTFFIEEHPGIPALLAITPIFFGIFKIPIAKKGLIKLWPDVPYYLDTKLTKNTDNDLDAFAPDQVYLGREDDMAELAAFSIDKTGKQSWTVLHGRMGRGKTRTALEWLKVQKDDNWDVGFLRSHTLDKIEDIGVYPFRKPTAIVIDEAGSEDQLWDILMRLLRQGVKYKQTLRVLVVDQFAPLRPQTLTAPDDKLLADKERKGHRLNPLSADTSDKMGALSQMSPSAIANCEGRPLMLRLGNDPWPEMRRRAATRLDMAGSFDEKSLLAYAALAGPVNVKKLPKALARIGLRKRMSLFEGEDKTVLKQTLPALRPGVFASEIIVQWMDEQQEDVIKDLVSHAISTHAAAVRARINSMLSDRPERTALACIASNDTAAIAELPPQTREIAQNLTLLGRLRPEDWPAAAADDIKVLYLQQHEAGEVEDIETMLDIHAQIKSCAMSWPNTVSVQIAFAETLSCVASHLRLPDGQVYLGAVLADLRQLTLRFPEQAGEIAVYWAKALFNAALHVGHDTGLTNRWERVDEYLGALQGLTTRYGSQEQAGEIAVYWAKALFNAALHVGEGAGLTNRWERLDGYLEELQRLTTRDASHAQAGKIVVLWASALYNVALHVGHDTGLTNRWERVDEYLGALQGLTTRYGSQEQAGEIAVYWARALANAALRAGEGAGLTNRWERVDGYLGELQGLTTRYASHTQASEIAVEWARALANATLHVEGDTGLANYWERVDRYLGELQGLTTRYASHTQASEIALEWARALFNAALYVGSDTGLANRWERVDGYLGELQGLTTRYAAHAQAGEIALEEARALFNATLHVGDDTGLANRWERVDGYLGELQGLTVRYGAHTQAGKIAVEWAKALVGAIKKYPQTELREFIDGVWRDLAHLSLRSLANVEMQGILNQHIPKLTFVNQQADNWPYGNPSKPED